MVSTLTRYHILSFLSQVCLVSLIYITSFYIFQVELTPGSGLFISKAAKSKVVVNAANDPYKLTRDILIELYGDQLKKKGLSAKGNGDAKEGIEDLDLLNIYSEFPFLLRV